MLRTLEDWIDRVDDLIVGPGIWLLKTYDCGSEVWEPQSLVA